MPSKPYLRRRKAHKAQVRERILDAARVLFAVDGFEAVTMRNIGERCDYTPSAIYKHFANKEAILDELRRDALSRLALALTEGLEEVHDRLGGPLAALREAASRYLAFSSNERGSYVLAFGTHTPDGHGGLSPAPVIEAFAELLARRRGDGVGGIEEYDRDHATVLWHALHGRALSPQRSLAEDVTFVDLCLGLLHLEAAPG
jgi:AcrR family transcriptional regulator